MFTYNRGNRTYLETRTPHSLMQGNKVLERSEITGEEAARWNVPMSLAYIKELDKNPKAELMHWVADKKK